MAIARILDVDSRAHVKKSLAASALGVAVVLALVPRPLLAETKPARAPDTAQGCQLVAHGDGPHGRSHIRVDVIARGLEVPWGIAFVSKTEMLVTERPGRVRLIRNGRLLKQPVATIPVRAVRESGLLGIAVDPDFARTRAFFVYYTFEKEGRAVNRVERYRLSEDGRSATAERVILDDIPSSPLHDGGRIRFGPDRMLYVSTGDARKPEMAQDPRSLSGKLLRMRPDGVVPADNPRRGSAVFLSGVRNSEGFDWIDPRTIAVTDNGPSGELGDRRGHDEIDVAKRGDNLGWPVIWGCEAETGMVSPSLTWQKAVPPGGAAVYTGDAIPEWKGSLLVGTLASKHLERIVFDPYDPRHVVQHETYLQGDVPSGYGRLRDVVMGMDGQLYVTTSNCDGRGTCPPESDVILRITR